MKLTLKQAKDSLSTYAVKAACPDSPDVVSRINQAQERFVKSGKFKDLMVRYVFCVNDCCITLPRELASIEGLDICTAPFRIRNEWYEFLESGPGELDCDSCMVTRNIVSRGDGFVTFIDICGTRKIRVYAEVSESADARILLQGFDQDGARIRTFDVVDNRWVDGEYVAITMPGPTISTNYFTILDGVQKPITNGFINLYAYNPNDLSQYKIAIYHPSETNPCYARYTALGLGDISDGTKVVAFCKRNYIPAVNDEDNLLITNTGALKNMLIALESEDNNNLPEAEGYEARAFKMLNDELSEWMGASSNSTIQVQAYAFGVGDVYGVQ